MGLDWQLMSQNHKSAKKSHPLHQELQEWQNCFLLVLETVPGPLLATASWLLLLCSLSRLLLQMFQCSSRLNLKPPKMRSTCLPQKSSLKIKKKIPKRDCSQHSLPWVNFNSLRMLDSLCLFVQQLLHLQMFPCSWSKVLHAKYNRVLFSRRIKHPLLATVTNPPL